jgi:hypothetical protein
MIFKKDCSGNVEFNILNRCWAEAQTYFGRIRRAFSLSIAGIWVSVKPTARMASAMAAQDTSMSAPPACDQINLQLA